MERIPDEIIGEILSRILDAREIVVASTTCKRWRRAMQHLKYLSFDLNDFRDLCHVLETQRLETIITRTIMQTKGLETLSVFRNGGGDDDEDVEVLFSTAAVRGWLMNAKDTLRALRLYADIYPKTNIFEKCQWNKLEFLVLAQFSFPSGGFSDMESFPCLKTLRLQDVKISAINLSVFIALCPKIKNLSLVLVDVGYGASLEWSIDSLKNIDVSAMSLERFVLDAGSLESFSFQCCKVQHLELVGTEALKELIINESTISHFGVGETITNLEDVDVRSSKIKGPELYRMISRSSNLRKLRLWPVTELEIISASFPQLTHLCLYYLEDADLSLQGSSLLENLVQLEFGSESYLYFSDIIGGFVVRCPNLKKVILHMFDSEPEDLREVWTCLPELSSFILQLGRLYQQVEFEFKYE